MLNPGDTLAQFTVEEKLGEGGMGAVYRARDTKLNRTVAIKVLPRDFLHEDVQRQRFQREARMAAQITHANVTAIYDTGEAPDPAGGPDIAYIVMEYVAGDPLNRYLQGRTLEIHEVLRLSEKIASGLAAAHKLEIVHRDIKPENIIVTEDGEPKILDFGLAKSAESPLQSSEVKEETVTIADDLTQVGRIVGTVNYMSPEQAQGEQLDTRSDIFSFGVLLYRLSTGESPFSGPTQVSTLAKIIEGTHQPAGQRNASVHPELDRIIDKCLQKAPGDRYQDTLALVSDLRQLRRQYDSGISESSFSQASMAAAAEPAKKRPMGVFAGVAALVAVAAVAAVLMLRGGDAGPSSAEAGEDRLAILAFENKTGDESLDWMETGLPEILLTDLTRCEGLLLVHLNRLRDELKRDGQAESPSHKDWLDAAQKLGASNALSGSFFKSGEQIRITTRLEEIRTGEVLFADQVSGHDAFALVDSLSGLVTAELHVPMQGLPGSGMAEVLTASTEAYKFYHLGDEILYLGQNEEALELYEKAIAADSSFALPYMRVGMVHTFSGRTKQGMEAFAKAHARREALPDRDRRLLDVYYDMWFQREYDSALEGMSALVRDYPDDKEALTIQGAILIGLTGDSTSAWAALDHVLELDPDFPLALSVYSDLLQTFGEFARARKLMEHFLDTYPDSPAPYEELGDIYGAQGDYAKALELFTEFRRRFPDNPDILNDMAALALRQGDFAAARRYMDERLELRPDDESVRNAHHMFLFNVAVWEGRFRDALSEIHAVADAAVAAQDSIRIFGTLMNIGGTHALIGERDSCVAYMARAHPFAPPQNLMRYPASVVELFPDRYPEMRKLYLEGANQFKSTVPENLWHLADGVGEFMEASSARDTTRLIQYYKDVMESTRSMGAANPGTSWELAKYLVKVGRYEEALPYAEAGHLSTNTTVPTTSGFRNLMTTYLMGVCYEGMGQADKAIGMYRKVLDHWGEADVQIDEIRDARRRLQGLSS